MNCLTETALRVSHYAPGSSMDPHLHEQASLCLVVEGSYREKVHALEHEHGPGHLLYYPAYAVHSQTFGYKGAKKIIFTPRERWAEHLSDAGIALAEAPFVQSCSFRQIAHRLLVELRKDDDYTEIACESLLLEIVAAFARRLATERESLPPQWLKTARDFVRSTPLVPRDLDTIAQVAGKHPAHVAREFRRFYGISVGAYQRNLRVERAAKLILKGKMELADIALCCGFASHAHLCRTFKAAYGVTPTEYRKELS